MVRLAKLGLLLGAAALLVAGTALADGGKGDDPVLCCQDASLSPPSAPTLGTSPGIFIFKGCQAIDPGPNAFNKCGGLVINCAETPAACVPDRDLGGKDCICGINLSVDVLLNLGPRTGTAPAH